MSSEATQLKKLGAPYFLVAAKEWPDGMPSDCGASTKFKGIQTSDVGPSPRSHKSKHVSPWMAEPWKLQKRPCMECS